MKYVETYSGNINLDDIEITGERQKITGLLHAWRDGDSDAYDQIMPLVYGDLQRLANYQMQGEASHHTLQPTELVHEAVVRLMDAEVDWQDRVHFFSVASRAMRRVLVDHARAKQADKRGGGALRITLSTGLAAEDDAFEDMLSLDQALEKLAALDSRKAHIVELVYFGGMEHEDIGRLLDISRTTVHRELRFSRAWLKRELGTSP